jgi:hypothetical protein
VNAWLRRRPVPRRAHPLTFRERLVACMVRILGSWAVRLLHRLERRRRTFLAGAVALHQLERASPHLAPIQHRDSTYAPELSPRDGVVRNHPSHLKRIVKKPCVPITGELRIGRKCEAAVDAANIPGRLRSGRRRSPMPAAQQRTPGSLLPAEARDVFLVAVSW